jgi:hypothetical protein
MLLLPRFETTLLSQGCRLMMPTTSTLPLGDKGVRSQSDMSPKLVVPYNLKL